MKRVDGFLDLDDYFRRTTKLKDISLDNLIEHKKVCSADAGSSAMFWFKCFGVELLFKGYNSEFSCISEMVSERLCYRLNLKTAKYDLAKYDDTIGVITYNFKDKNKKYIDLYDILAKYDEYYYQKNNKYIDSGSNLEDIWHALEFYFYSDMRFPYEEIPHMVAKIMKQITDRFIFQLISGDFDMHAGNMELEIASDYQDVELTPIYDNEDMFKLGGLINYKKVNSFELNIDASDEEEETEQYELVDKYLNVTSSEFIARFKELLDLLDENTMDEIFIEIEDKIEMDLSEYYNFLKERFNYNFKILKEKVNNYIQKR